MKTRSVRTCSTKVPRRAEWPPVQLAARIRLLKEEKRASYDDVPDQEAREKTLKVLTLLWGDSRMKSVWRSLSQRRHMSDIDVDRFTDKVVRCVLEHDAIPRRSRSQHRLYFREVAKLARRLDQRIRKDLGQQDARCSAYYDTRHLRRFLPAESIPRDSHQSIASAVMRWMSTQGPSFSDVLDDLSREADLLAQRRPILGKPQAKNARAQYVALRLCDFFRRIYKTPLYMQVAEITNVVCRSDLDPEAVRKLASRRRS